MNNNTLLNSLTGLAELMSLRNDFTEQVAQQNTLIKNCRYYLVSNNRVLLTHLYVEHGIVQAFIDQPVDDAFRGDLTIKTDQLSSDEIKDLLSYCEENGVIRTVTQGIKWARLYGGSGLVINTNQPSDRPLNMKAINEKSPLELYAADLWELQHNNVEKEGIRSSSEEEKPYMFYGQRLDRSRVIVIKGKEAPAFIRKRLYGWGMSELEKVVVPLNEFFKNHTLIFELLDEAKIDVYKIRDYTNTLMVPGGAERINTAVSASNKIKNYQSALILDAEDEYEQKQITFAGLAEILKEIRIGIACALRMPMTKLFGLSAAGFNSGEDDIENYNAMVEAEIRSKDKYVLIEVLKLYCQKLFGRAPDDLNIDFEPLRIMSTEQEELIKERRFNRLLQSYQLGIIDEEEFRQGCIADALLPVNLEKSEIKDGNSRIDSSNKRRV